MALWKDLLSLHPLLSKHDRNTSGAWAAASQLHSKCSILPFHLCLARAKLLWLCACAEDAPSQLAPDGHREILPANKHERSAGLYLNHTSEEAASSQNLFTPKGLALCKSKESKGRLISTSKHLRMLTHFWHIYIKLAITCMLQWWWSSLFRLRNTRYNITQYGLTSILFSEH